MAIIKRLLIVLVVLSMPLILGLLFTYDIIKIEWISFMEIQPSYNWQEDPLPLPARSIPIEGPAYIPELAAPVNPIPVSENSLARGKFYYDINCAICHGARGNGQSTIRAFLQERPPFNLLEDRSRNLSDGEIFLVITNGIEGAMPALKQNLPETEMRWSVVNYLRSLQDAAQ
jgi:mono/diheme cytochrome c family protein